MTTLIENLRALARHEHSDLTVAAEAADEIERQRAIVEAENPREDSLLVDANAHYSSVQREEIARVERERLRHRIAAAMKSPRSAIMLVGPGEPDTRGRHRWDMLRFTADEVLEIAAALTPIPLNH